MTFPTDDLATVLVAPDREHTGYGQGILVAFDNDTFENIVEYRGTQLTNLPVLDRIGALTYAAGDVVLLMRWSPSGGGLSSWWIAGAPVIPGDGRAEAAIAFLSGRLARQISSQVFVDRVHSAFEAGQTTTSDTDFSNGTAAGPIVPDIEVSEVGTLLVLWGADISAGPITDGGQIGGFMGIEIDGPTPEAPSIGDAAFIGQSVTVVGSSWSHRTGGQFLTGQLYTGRAPGTYSIAGKYATQVGGETAAFSDRLIVAISS